MKLIAVFRSRHRTSHVVCAKLGYTLAVGKDGRASDAYGAENQFIAQQMAELESVSARKATILNPTEDDETVQVLKRRLFASVDPQAAEQVVQAYLECWQSNRESLPSDRIRPEMVEVFRASYPLHPDVLATLTGKTATVANFQRVRGMLRLLARTVSELWRNQPQDATAIHVHHIDPGFEPIRQEFVTRLGMSMYTPTIANDISGERGKTALAQDLDQKNYSGLPPYASYVARTIFLHSIAFPISLAGVAPDRLRFSVVGPALDLGFIEDARKRFQEQSAYMDDRPGAPLRFLTEANLTQILERQIQLSDAGTVRAELNSRIGSTYLVGDFELKKFPGTAGEVPDETGAGKPLLVLLSYDSVSIGSTVDHVPELVARIHKHVGSDERGFRKLLNNLVFVVADHGRVGPMRRSVAKALALKELVKPERLKDMAVHQQEKLREMDRGSILEVNQAIQHCYRHVFYPSKQKLSEESDLAHTAIEMTSTDQVDGQRAIVRALRELNKLRLSDDQPDSPTLIRDRTPLRKGQITTLDLRGEFRRDVGLPILIGDSVFSKGIREGVRRGEYIYKYREKLYAPGDPETHIDISEDAFVYTMAFAKERGIWPLPPPPPPPGETRDSATLGGGPGAGAPFHLTGGQHPVTPPFAGAPGGAAPTSGMPSGRTFQQEGPLRQALSRLFEDAKSARVTSLRSISIRLTELLDASRLLTVATGVPGATVVVKMEGHYETGSGGAFQFEFDGPVEDAVPLRDFLTNEFRVAAERECITVFSLSYAQGLMLAGDGPENLIDKLTKQAVGAAYVTASAEVG